MATRLRAHLLEPVDAASVGVFRIVFGVLLLIATLRFVATGCIAEYYEMPSHFFHYAGFEWVRPWPGPGMYIHFGVMAVLAGMVILGRRPRLAVALFGALFAYAHLIDKTNYLNHYYLVICLCGLMACLPIASSTNVERAAVPKGLRRSIASSTNVERAAVPKGLRRSIERTWTHVPRWVVWALRAQVGLVYVFGGIAKLKYDWIVDAQPMTIWLSANSDFPVIGALFDEKWVAYAFSWAGLVFDLSIVPLLLWSRSRPFAYAAVIVFHVVTARLFNLGMFPWLMIGCSLIFLPPDWPRRLLARPVLVKRIAPTKRPRLALSLLAIYVAFHALMPLRHLAYPGDVCWTEEGFRFAWNVMVMEKDGSVVLHVREPSTDRRWEVSPSAYLTRYQTKMMSSQPDMILELAHLVAADFRARGLHDPEVTVDAFVSLNGRRRARLIDPTVDLARIEPSLGHATWILEAPP
jgi:vitamin K-dependent gamma-carboxylase